MATIYYIIAAYLLYNRIIIYRIYTKLFAFSYLRDDAAALLLKLLYI